MSNTHITPGVTKNEFGFWVGTITYPSGVVASITNAKSTKNEALEIVEIICNRANERADETRVKE